MFDEVSANVNFPALEQRVIEFWNASDIFRKSLHKDAPQGDYVFYEGPPTANGRPGVHHVISRAFKDLFPRFKTMQGYHVGRKGGWDTHGLPVELEIEKKLGFEGKKDIEDFGVAEFNKLAKASAFEYIQEWNEMTERIGFWLDLDDAYVTYENDYIESCWWVMKSLWERGLLFEDYKVTMHCPRCNTSLADHEVSQGFEDDVDDPSVYPKFPLHKDKVVASGLWPVEDGRDVYMMAWTTTPWTLPANTALAVKEDAEYGLFAAPRAHGSEGDKDLYILATALAERVFGEGNYETLKTFRGSDLVGLTYDPVLLGRVPGGEDVAKGFRVLADEMVSLDDGTGVVHLAPAYGDLELGTTYGLPTLFSVDLAGEVFPEVRALPGDPTPGPYTGQFFKEADKAIAKDLLERNLLYRETRIKHAYPFCWRCHTALLYYAKSSWYVRTTAVKDKLLANNQKIDWYPEHIKGGRFGKWLENNVDWALSRERYWGAPLPVWVSEDGQENHCVGSVKELEELTGQDFSDLELHRPYVDDITFEKNGKTFRRLPYTVDVWFESGAMPYAQWHYPFENQDKLAPNFPADYICEAIDQTRGWFYSLHAIATLLTDSGDDDDAGQRAPGALAEAGVAVDTSSFKNCIVLGHILDENGEKMSKSKGNIVNPWDVLNAQGADALRWYLYSSSPPGNSKRFSESLVDETLRDFLLTLWNTYSFFVLYANLDKPDLSRDVPVAERSEIDRWLVAKTNTLVRDVTAMLENYDPTGATRAIRDFVVDDLSNWYVRRNRRRFWKSDTDTDKLAAYTSLYEALVTVAKLMAPMAPFVSEELYRNLVLNVDKTAPESVHLAQWPSFDADLINETLLRDMGALVRVVELGRSARNASGIKTRQPLNKVTIGLQKSGQIEGLQKFEQQIAEELNVKNVVFTLIAEDSLEKYYVVRPNLPRIGKRLGKNVPAFRDWLKTRTPEELKRLVRSIHNKFPVSYNKLFLTLNGQDYVFVPEDIEIIPPKEKPFVDITEHQWRVLAIEEAEARILNAPEDNFIYHEGLLIDVDNPEGQASAEGDGVHVVFDTKLTLELIQEGLARDVIRLVQNARKNAGLEVSDFIRVGLETSGSLQDAVEAHRETIAKEVLARELTTTRLTDAYEESAEVEGTPLTLTLKKVAVAEAV